MSQRACPGCKRVMPHPTVLTSVVTLANHISKCWSGAHFKEAEQKDLASPKCWPINCRAVSSSSDTFAQTGRLRRDKGSIPAIYPVQ